MNFQDIVGLAVAFALFSSLSASIVLYQRSPAEKKWLCAVPLGSYFVVGGGAAFVLGVMTGAKIIDVETSRYIIIAIMLLIIAFCIFPIFRRK